MDSLRLHPIVRALTQELRKKNPRDISLYMLDGNEWETRGKIYSISNVSYEINIFKPEEDETEPKHVINPLHVASIWFYDHKEDN